MKRSFAIVLALYMAGAPLLSHAELQVQVKGAVDHPGTLTLKDGARLSDAALAAHVQEQAYLLGAAWLRPSLLVTQERLKAGILYDLDQLHLRAMQHGDTALSDTVGQLHTATAALPVTGRAPALLAPRAVEVNITANLPLLPGDRLFYPLRPKTIRVVGAVRSPCSLPLQPLQDASGYLAQCPSAYGADHDWIYVIQPDGHVLRQGVALWNRSTPLSLAPGALIYVPLSARAVSTIDITLNSDMADFLATQILPGPETMP
ncbi:capsule biosynthesis GfcC family protein [Rhodanobacter sp. DHG33]|uniref:capsule biosynthesis GfcC family protein n=1 Tax=Rhodanobacter sp. DHG33 TaxID=2775921 RepID=UPI0017867627|nr:capsule biosynthesis GfcC family protein [Rhodanobacter sp. DHG33]MBD8897445.1 capsule biosynthesis GfcC family protein [Rhodanobacter sp. DHG33]